MNNCEKYQLMIESYIEGELTEADKVTLEEHVKDCPACRTEYAEAQTLAIVLDESFQPRETDGQVADSIVTSISNSPVPNKRPHRYPVFAKIAAGLIIAAGLFLSFQAGRISNQFKTYDLTKAPYSIQTLEGTVLVKHANSQTWQPLTADSTIYVDDQFMSSPNSQVKFAIDKQSYIELKENSMLVLEISPDKTNLHLTHGELDADLASPHGPFFVTTPHGRAEALGTKFTVKVD